MCQRSGMPIWSLALGLESRMVGTFGVTGDGPVGQPARSGTGSSAPTAPTGEVVVLPVNHVVDGQASFRPYEKSASWTSR